MTWPTAGGNWEGGFTDKRGRRWIHEPRKGWRAYDRPVYLKPRQVWCWWMRLRRWLP